MMVVKHWNRCPETCEIFILRDTEAGLGSEHADLSASVALSEGLDQ